MRPVVSWERLRKPCATEDEAHAAVLAATDKDWVVYRKAVEDVVVFKYVEKSNESNSKK